MSKNAHGNKEAKKPKQAPKSTQAPALAALTPPRQPAGPRQAQPKK